MALKWRIAWRQVVGNAGELQHIDEVEAPHVAVAISRWSQKSWCNAIVDAVWCVGSGRFIRQRGAGRRPAAPIEEEGKS